MILEGQPGVHSNNSGGRITSFKSCYFSSITISIGIISIMLITLTLVFLGI